MSVPRNLPAVIIGASAVADSNALVTRSACSTLGQTICWHPTADGGVERLVGRAPAVVGQTAFGPTAFAVGRPLVLIFGKLPREGSELENPK